MFKRIPGTKDILPEQAAWWVNAEQLCRDTLARYNYKEIRPPLIEEAALFNRSLGDSAEIVQKQMFLIKKGEDVYALRPEGTASVARAYLENSLDKSSGFVKLYYTGPMFRLERPQKGRYRQFHHIGCEAIGSYDPDLDVEMISLADVLLKGMGISGYTIKVNTLGCLKDKKALSDSLRSALKEKEKKLCEECRLRLQRNVLRILDCKNDACRELVKSLDIRHKHLCPECAGHFSRVEEGLCGLGIKYEVAYSLVRGLDYYTRTVFEFVHDGLGQQQDALGAGGRYDNLVAELGGEPAGAIGFAFGMERLSLVSGKEEAASGKTLTYIIPLGEGAKKYAVTLLHKLRGSGIHSDTDYESRSLKGAMRRANDLGAKYVLIIGDEELKKGVIALKDMDGKEQKELTEGQLIKELTC